MKKKDALVIGIVVLLAAAALLAGLLMRRTDGAHVAVIYLNGEEYARVSLERDDTEEIEIKQEDGCVNIVEVFKGGARMKYSTCKNQLCVKKGGVTEETGASLDNGNLIVCLPNRVTVEILGGGGE